MRDLILVGGGLANSLIALALAHRRPELKVAMFEREASFGGQHTWSFHESDLEPSHFEWLRSRITSSWSGHEVRFPGFERDLEGGYHSLRSEELDGILRSLPSLSLYPECAVQELRPQGVRLVDGAVFEARCVIDGRGLRAPSGDAHGFQKFVGLSLLLCEPHGLTRPLLMDARCEQREGYRFFYVLPWDERRVLVEDTRYCSDPLIDREDFLAEIHRYARARGWNVEAIEREEHGSLPLPLASSRTPPEHGLQDVPCSGMRAGFFNHTTSYSVPVAARFAEIVASLDPLTSSALLAECRRFSLKLWQDGSFYRLLNRLLFQAAEPQQRYRVLEKFYRQPQSLIERFYNGKLMAADKLRILSGRPPVPLLRAMRCFL